jgi:methylated-DNA-protein-cysteine methyltransferase-like protein
VSGRPWRERVWRLVRRVPRGRVISYGQVARRLGAPRAARAVGQAMRTCPENVPWHRVVNGRGAISRRRDGSGMVSQRLLLEVEGVRFSRGRVDLGRFGWRGGAGGDAGRGCPPERWA